ncbi:MAG: SPOR domain-containing protein [Actinomycetales bacterium]|nr:SPOR domain-containing protein [Actinomycetales bacterium]
MTEYYFNLETRQVEEGRVSEAMHRMGPYPTREAAEHAMEHARERNAEWEDADRRWNEDEEDDRHRWGNR